MSEQIQSRNDLFPGQLIDKPPLATILFDAAGEPLYVCPYCRDAAPIDDHDCIGAEPNCLFCNRCNREFELPPLYIAADGSLSAVAPAGGAE
jgi:hypothetical protein